MDKELLHLASTHYKIRLVPPYSLPSMPQKVSVFDSGVWIHEAQQCEQFRKKCSMFLVILQTWSASSGPWNCGLKLKCSVLVRALNVITSNKVWKFETDCNVGSHWSENCGECIYRANGPKRTFREKPINSNCLRIDDKVESEEGAKFKCSMV